MKNKKTVLLIWVLALLPAVMLALVWNRLPENVPMHWDVHNHVDRWGSPMSLWALSAVGPLMAVMFRFLPRIDPKRANYEKFQLRYELSVLATELLMVVVMAAVLTESLAPGRLNIAKVIGLAVGVIFIVMGNLMGKVKTNWFMGIRTPWALSDPDVWNRTQRLGGWVFFLSGALLIVLCLLAPPEVTFGAFMAVLLGGIALTYYKSWKWYRKKTDM